MTNLQKQERFIEKAKTKYGDKYDYSKVNYIDSTTSVCIICPIHGEFWQKPSTHLNVVHGCPECAKELSLETVKPTVKKRFIQRANLKYNNKFDYSKVEYVDYYTPVCIICPKHGEFWQSPFNHVNKYHSVYACPECAQEIAKLKTLTTEQFIEKAKEKHGNKFDYSKVNYINSHTDVCIICSKHGEFWINPSQHLAGYGCKKCYEEKLQQERETKIKNFIEKARELYGDRYDYSNVKTIAYKKGVPIFDNEKQTFFQQTPDEHLKGCGYNESNIITWYRMNSDIYSYYYNLAKQYDDLYDLYREHKKSFGQMKKNGYLKDYTWLKNNRERKVKNSLVYAYEFSDHAVYVGLTKSLNRRDKQHRERRYHSNGKSQYDGVLDYSIKYNIEIPEVKILIDNLTKDESGLEEIKWIQFYKDNGWKIINRNNGGATGSGIVSKSKWMHETVIEEAKKYKCMEEMRQENHSAYKYMERWGLKKECFPNAKLQVHQPNRIYTKELIEETVKKCPRKVDLRNMDMAMYIYLHQHNMIYDYYPEGRVNNRVYTKELIESVVKQFPRKIDLMNGDKAMYNYLLKHKMLYNYFPRGPQKK